MKKLLFGVLCFISTFTNAQQSILPLEQNETFLSCLQKQEELTAILIKTLGNDVSKIKSVEEQLIKLQIDLSNTEVKNEDEAFLKVINLLNLPRDLNLKEIFITLHKGSMKLQSEYGDNFSKENIELAINKIYSTTSGKLTPGQAYLACTVVAHTAAILAYGGCVGATWGFGAVFCLSIISVGQTAAIAVCAHEYLP